MKTHLLQLQAPALLILAGALLTPAAFSQVVVTGPIYSAIGGGGFDGTLHIETLAASLSGASLGPSFPDIEVSGGAFSRTMYPGTYRVTYYPREQKGNWRRTWTITTSTSNPVGVWQIESAATATPPTPFNYSLVSGCATASLLTFTSAGLGNCLTPGASGYLLKSNGTSTAPSWFNLLGTANTFTAKQTFGDLVTTGHTSFADSPGIDLYQLNGFPTDGVMAGNFRLVATDALLAKPLVASLSGLLWVNNSSVAEVSNSNAINGEVHVSNSNITGGLSGVYGGLYFDHPSGTITSEQTAASFYGIVFGAGAVSRLTTLWTAVPQAFTGSITDAIALHVQDLGNDNGTKTNAYGIKIESVTYGTNKWALMSGAGLFQIGDHRLVLTPHTPASGAESCTANTFYHDDTYLYICTSGGVLKRTSSLSTF